MVIADGQENDIFITFRKVCYKTMFYNRTQL